MERQDVLPTGALAVAWRDDPLFAVARRDDHGPDAYDTTGARP